MLKSFETYKFSGLSAILIDNSEYWQIFCASKIFNSRAMGFRPTAEELAELIEEIDEDGRVGTNHSAASGHVPQCSSLIGQVRRHRVPRVRAAVRQVPGGGPRPRDHEGRAQAGLQTLRQAGHGESSHTREEVAWPITVAAASTNL